MISISFIIIGLFELSVSTQLNFDNLWFSKRLIFPQLSIYDHNAGQVFHYLFNNCKICSDSLCFIPDVDNCPPLSSIGEEESQTCEGGELLN